MPEFAHLPLSTIDSGWDNVVFRLGTDLALRLPQRELAAGIIRHEQKWLPALAPALPIPVPAPLHVGEPGCGYPWFWSIVPWFDGANADVAPLRRSEASRYVAFLKALHVPAPAEALENRWRGVPLRNRAEHIGKLRNASLTRIWQDALAAKEDDSPTWIHGDLHPRNVLVEDGKITAIIDWGDICSGDRATDLASLWMLFSDSGTREQALREYAPDGDTIARAKGWAVLLGSVFLASGDERQSKIGESTLGHLESGSTC